MTKTNKKKKTTTRTVKPFTVSPRAKRVPQNERHTMPPEAFEHRNIKVRITMFLDLDVLNGIKARAAENGTPYQTMINAELRQLVEAEQPETADTTANLERARTLIDAAIRTQQAAVPAKAGR